MLVLILRLAELDDGHLMGRPSLGVRDRGVYVLLRVSPLRVNPVLSLLLCKSLGRQS